MQITGPLLAVVGVLFLLLAWLMADDRLPRNGLVGMRTRATTASEAAWSAAHRASAWSVGLAGVVLLVGGTWLSWARRSPGHSRNVVLGTCLATLVIIAIGGIQAHRVAKGTTGTASSAP